ncbi:ISH3 family transposase [Sulfolobus sp. E11-6]|nr:ISH3 family transposase [Sulfolobus sp. E11-6]QGA68935.1 ISH3 family transposase [Sulfolobus sp. E11-6]
MVIQSFPHLNNVQQIGYKLLSMINFKGKRGEEVTRTLVSAALWNDSIENKAKIYNVSPQTVRNYVEKEEITDKLLEHVKQISLKVLRGVKEVDLSIDWTTVKWYGKPVKGLGSSERGYSWNYATATTKHEGKILLLAFIPQVNGMTKDEVVKMLVEQVSAMGFKVNLITLDAGFYSVKVINFISQFKYIISVPVGEVKIYGEFDGEYVTNSKKHKRGEQVKFRLIVHGKEKIGKKKRVEYIARATNLDLPKDKVLKLYDKVRNPIETSYRNIKSFLLFTSSTKFAFRTLAFLLAMLLYSLFTLFKSNVKREDFRLLFILSLSDNIFNEENYLIELEKTLSNTVDLF